MGFALPASRIAELRSHLDFYARERLTLADFEPALEVDGEIALSQVNPEFYQALRKLEPFGMGNPEPIFSARNVRLCQPPRLIKEKHAKLKLAATGNGEASGGNSSWRRAITYDAMAWRMGERVQQEQLLPGDLLDVAFTIGHNDHPEYGGLELTLCDFTRTKPANQENVNSARAT